jgi:two-component system cell cycle response regulator PopA
LTLEHALAGVDGTVTAAFSSFVGFDHLHDDTFDAVVINAAQEPSTAISFCAALRRNAGLRHLPTLIITAPDDVQTAKAAIDRGATASVSEAGSTEPGLGWLFEAVRRERRCHAAEHSLRVLRDIMGDPRTGLFQPDPFAAHLSRLAADHHTNGRPLSLAILHVLPAHGGRTPPPHKWSHGLNEIASVTAQMLRDADSGAAIGHDCIAVALPDTCSDEAARTARRIASVCECTAFASGENDAGPLVFEQGAVELQPGESGAGMLARALATLDLDASRIA